MPKKTRSDPPESDLDKLRRHIRILVDLGRVAGQSSTLDHFLDQAVIQVARAVEVEHVKVLRYRRETADLLIVAGMGWKQGVVGAAVFPSDLRSPPGRAFLTAGPVNIPDTADAQGFVISEVLKDHEVTSLVNVPILFGGTVWGVLEADSSVPREFSADSVDFMMAASALIAVAIQRLISEGGHAAALAKAAEDTQHQEVLLRELQHRVKNSFQIVLASIALQKRRFGNAEIHQALDPVANRIIAISLAHDQLAPRKGSQAVDVAGYLRALCASIEQQADNVAFDVDTDQVELALERTVPLGLILNEAAINSVKHAFGEDGGRITVTLRTGIGYGEARLIVADNGKGIRDPRQGGSGLKLISLLAGQIGGEVEQESSGQGTSIAVTFPVIT